MSGETPNTPRRRRSVIDVVDCSNMSDRVCASRRGSRRNESEADRGEFFGFSAGDQFGADLYRCRCWKPRRPGRGWLRSWGPRTQSRMLAGHRNHFSGEVTGIVAGQKRNGSRHRTSRSPRKQRRQPELRQHSVVSGLLPSISSCRPLSLTGQLLTHGGDQPGACPANKGHAVWFVTIFL